MIREIKFLYVAFAVIVTAAVCSWLTQIGISGWYNSFDKPMITPPNNVFPIVWTLIYALLIASVSNILAKANASLEHDVWQIFLIQLGLQILWCLAFFTEGLIGLGLIVILLLDAAAYQMIRFFFRINKFSAYLLLPYVAWLVFATLLNILFAATGILVVSF